MQPKVLEIISEFIHEDKSNDKQLQNNLWSYKSIFQYVYSIFFPEIYCSTEKRGLESPLGKNPKNYKSIHNETNIYEQKPISIDQFNEIEEAKVKERVEKRKQKRREVAEKNKLLKKKTTWRNKSEKKKIYDSVWQNSMTSSKR